MEKLRLPFLLHAKACHWPSPASELPGTVHHFAALSRFITDVDGLALLDFVRMDSQFRAFEAPPEATLSETATPLRCPHAMIAQPLVPWTPARLLGALLTALLWGPALRLQPAINRRRA
jgi:hypothetical protein